MKQEDKIKQREEAVRKSKAKWQKKDRAANPEKYREIARRYWKNRKAKMLAGKEPAPVGRPRKDAPRDNIATPQTLKRWRDANKDRYRKYIREYMRKYREEKRDKVRQIYKDYCERQKQTGEQQ